MRCESCNKKHNGKFASGRFCSQFCASSFSTKSKRKEINRKIGEKLKGRTGWRKGITKYSKIKCPICDKEFYPSYAKRKYCSKKCFYQDTKFWKKHHLKLYHEGLNRVGGGTTKWYKYKDIKVQGTFELRTCYILDCLKNEEKIKDWEYTNDRFEYLDCEGKKRTYLLDFKIFNIDNSSYYLETKGYIKENDELKWQSVRDKGYRLDVWFLEDIKYNEKELDLSFQLLPEHVNIKESDNCKFCQKKYVKKSKIQKFCSFECCVNYKGKSNIEIKCCYCNKKIKRSPSYLKSSKHNKHFCNIDCKSKAQKKNGILYEYNKYNRYNKMEKITPH